jgi:hypothetical protein
LTPATSSDAFATTVAPRPAWALIVAALAAGLLAACAAQPPRAPAPFDSVGFQGFLTPRPLVPFQATGAVLFSFRGERESGQMALQVTAEPAIRLQLLANLTGSLALEVRFDPERLLVLDYANQTYYRGVNDAQTRLRLFEVDLNPAEFLILLTGRVSRDAFAAGEGVLNREPPRSAAPGAAPQAWFSEGGGLLLFWLDEWGLPSRWVKMVGGEPVFRVEYREYAEVPTDGGPTLRLPRKIRLYLRDSAPLMVLGIARIEPGAGAQPAVALTALPEGARDFAPGRLPEPVPSP